MQLPESIKNLPTYVKQEFEDFLACGRLDRGAIDCVAIRAVPSLDPKLLALLREKSYGEQTEPQGH